MNKITFIEKGLSERTFDGKSYMYIRTYNKKGDAQVDASYMRAVGKLARVIKPTKGFGKPMYRLYMHRGTHRITIEERIDINKGRESSDRF